MTFKIPDDNTLNKIFNLLSPDTVDKLVKQYKEDVKEAKEHYKINEGTKYSDNQDTDSVNKKESVYKPMGYDCTVTLDPTQLNGFFKGYFDPDQSKGKDTQEASKDAKEKLDKDIYSLIDELKNYKSSISNGNEPRYSLIKVNAEQAFWIVDNLNKDNAVRLADELNGLVKKGDPIKYEVWEDE